MLFLSGQVENHFKDFFHVASSKCELHAWISDLGGLLYKNTLLKCYANVFNAFEKLKESIEEFCRYQCGMYLESALVAYTYLKLYIMWISPCVQMRKEADTGAESSSCSVVQKLLISRALVCAIRLVLWWLQGTLWSKWSTDEWNISVCFSSYFKGIKGWHECRNIAKSVDNYKTASITTLMMEHGIFISSFTKWLIVSNYSELSLLSSWAHGTCNTCALCCSLCAQRRGVIF